MAELVFVYGTLKRGHGNSERCLADAGAEFIGEAVSVEAKFSLESAGVPFLIAVKENGAKIAGELFSCPEEAMKRCDRLEGHPRSYERKQEQFLVGDKVVTAWVYLWPRGGMSHPVEPVDGVITWNPESMRQRFLGNDDIEEDGGDDGRSSCDDEDEEGVEVSANDQGELMLHVFSADEDATAWLDKEQFEKMVADARQLMGW